MLLVVMWRCFLLCFGLLPLSAGSVKVISNEVEALKPIQLTEGSFDSEVLRIPSSTGVMVEFYAHWYALKGLTYHYALVCTEPASALLRCPTCQAFQPAYEEVAAYFHTEPKVQPEVWVARVDCATEVCRLTPNSLRQSLCLMSQLCPSCVQRECNKNFAALLEPSCSCTRFINGCVGQALQSVSYHQVSHHALWTWPRF